MHLFWVCGGLRKGHVVLALGKLKMADSLWCMPGRSDKDFEDQRILDLHTLLGVWGGEEGI